jgi:hypothetical protein
MSTMDTKIMRHAIAAVGALVALLLAAPAAHADFGIQSVGGAVTMQDGSPAVQAGSHPFQARLVLRLNRHLGGPSFFGVTHLPDGDVKDVSVDLPAGFIGNPTAVPQCDEDVLQSTDLNSQCPAITQVGVALNELNLYENTPLHTPIYNMKPPRGMAAQFAFNIVGVIAHFNIKLRDDGSYGVTIDANYLSQALGVLGSDVRLWGVPSDPAWDAWRVGCLSDGGPTGALCRSQGAVLGAGGTAFLSNPTDCSAGPLTTTVRVRSWQQPEVWQSASFDRDLDGVPMAVEGCAAVPFEPTLQVSGVSSAPDAPTGMDVDLGFGRAGLLGQEGLAPSPLRRAVVTLPEGMTINPAAAGGLQACDDAQLNRLSSAPVSCPEAARIGAVTVKTPLLHETIGGDVYVGSQLSSDPASGDMFRLFLNLVHRERGIDVKLRGGITADPATGRLVATFDNNPQLPVDDIMLQFKSGPRAPLATPATCGDHTIDAQLTSWAGHVVTRHATYTTACTSGLGGFAPTVAAGSADERAGASAPFWLTLNKPDGNSALNGLSLTLPSGLLARVKGNLGTQVGSVKAFAGPGSNPFMLPGQVYLEGPYGDAPFSLKVVVPAKAGPFDLGEVVVRQKIYVDPIDGHVTVVSDPVPTIVKGVPVRLQRLDVSVDKPGFMINPTSCAAKAIGGTLNAVSGQTAPVNVRFQVGDCAALGLKPRLGLTLSGKGQTTDGKHPAVTATLTQPAGQANLKKVRVALPLSLALDPDNANGLCEFVDGSKPDPTCPKASIVGTATATTPILDEPLSGPVYFVKNVRKDPKSGREIRTLPKLVIPLAGQNGVKLTLTGTSAVARDQLVTTFDNIPDAPVSSFKLNIKGGKGGILTVSDADICKSAQIAEQEVDGQNGKQADANVSIQTPSCPTKVLSTKVGKTSVAIKVGGLGAGKVTVTGEGIKKTTRTITKSTVATITAKRANGRLGKVKVSFRATGTKTPKVAYSG